MYVFIFVTSLTIVSTKIGGGEKYDSKNACTIHKSSWEGKKCCQDDHMK